MGISRSIFFFFFYLPLVLILFHSMDTAKPPPQLTAVTLAGIHAQSKAQMEAWQQRTERHEEIALGLEMMVSQGKMERWLEEIGRRVEGLERA